MTETMTKAINDQIHSELSAYYSYLAMSAHCDRAGFPGAAKWLRLQSSEEQTHAMKLLDFLLARHAKVGLRELGAPRIEYKSLLDVFETAFKQEQSVSAQIEALYELAFKEKAYPAVVQLEWFLTEQVEEEKTCREIVAKLKMVGDDPASLLEIDRELGARSMAGVGKNAE
ncbi:MAG TPA: ferritin [Candidatus Polarisedimenticolaceae bacterium]|nr:ferritin [Candidatus Polarisedimenticolaceae bacterium]